MTTQRAPSTTSAKAASSIETGWDREALRELLATRSFKRGDFTLASGRKSPVYFNVKTTMMHPQGAALCARGLMTVLADLNVDLIAGLEMGAVPLLSVVSAFSANSERPIQSFFVRKVAKQHGSLQRIEGLDDFGGEGLTRRHIVLIDDVATSGGSILEAVGEIVAAGGIVTDAIVILDREEGAAERLAGQGIKLHALFTAVDLGVTQADRKPC